MTKAELYDILNGDFYTNIVDKLEGERHQLLEDISNLDFSNPNSSVTAAKDQGKLDMIKTFFEVVNDFKQEIIDKDGADTNV